MDALTASSPLCDCLIVTRPKTHGGRRKGAGRKSLFASKAVEKPFAMDFTPEGRELLDAIIVRTGLSRNAVLSVLAIAHADDLTFNGTRGVVYPNKSGLVYSIRTPRAAGSKLRHARRRTRKGFSDIGEALVRQFGAVTTFPAPPGAAIPPSEA